MDHVKFVGWYIFIGFVAWWVFWIVMHVIFTYTPALDYLEETFPDEEDVSPSTLQHSPPDMTKLTRTYFVISIAI